MIGRMSRVRTGRPYIGGPVFWDTDFNIGAPLNFDEGTYLRLNPDVAAAYAGVAAGGAKHYDAHGAKEGRIYLPDFPSDFDAAAYLAMYPDIAASVSSGTTPSAQFHYQAYGRAEGRAYKAGMKPTSNAAVPPLELKVTPIPGGTSLTPTDPSGNAVGPSVFSEEPPFYKKPKYLIGGGIAAAILVAIIARRKG